MVALVRSGEARRDGPGFLPGTTLYTSILRVASLYQSSPQRKVLFRSHTQNIHGLWRVDHGHSSYEITPTRGPRNGRASVPRRRGSSRSRTPRNPRAGGSTPRCGVTRARAASAGALLRCNTPICAPFAVPSMAGRPSPRRRVNHALERCASNARPSAARRARPSCLPNPRDRLAPRRTLVFSWRERGDLPHRWLLRGVAQAPRCCSGLT